MLFLGIGWGYHIPGLLKKFPDTKFIFFEPIRQIHTVLSERGRLGELRREGAEIEENLDRIAGQKLKVIVFPSLLRIWPDIIQDLFSDRTVDRSTSEKFFRRWTLNFFHRLIDFRKIRFITEIQTDFQACIYCGAGPDLLEELSRLRNSISNIMIIASDTALAPLLAAKIIPHIIISIDAGRGTEYHLSAAKKLNTISFPSDIPVISWMPGAAILDTYFSDIYFYPSSFPFDQFLSQYTELPVWENPSRNLIGIALHLAKLAGFASLYTAGADFTSRDGRSHERGTGYSWFALQKIARNYSLEMYRPGGYSSELTRKNQLASDGTDKLSRELKVQVLPLSQGNLPEKLIPGRMKIHSASFSNGDLIKYMLQIWKKIPFSELNAGKETSFKKLEEKIYQYLKINPS